MVGKIKNKPIKSDLKMVQQKSIDKKKGHVLNRDVLSKKISAVLQMQKQNDVKPKLKIGTSTNKNNPVSLNRKRPLPIEDNVGDDDDEDSEDEDDSEQENINLIKKEKSDSDEEKDSDDDYDDNAQPVKKKSRVVVPPTPESFHARDEKSIASTKLSDSPPVNDPELRVALEKRIANRWKCTVRVRPVPSKCTEAMLLEVCPEMVACRIPWNTIKHRSKGVAFLEFADPEAAERWEKALGNISLGNRALKADRRGMSGLDTESLEDEQVSVDDFNARRLVVTGLHWRCTKEQLMDIFKGAVRVDFLPHVSPMQHKAMQGVAFVGFADERTAMAAFDEMQGLKFQGRRLSVLFQRRRKQEENSARTELLVFGLKQSTTEPDLKALFARSSDIVLKGGGMAVIYYPDAVSCAADFHLRVKGTTLHKRSLKVFFGSKHLVGKRPEVQAVNGKKVKTVLASETSSIKTNVPETPVDHCGLFVRNLHSASSVAELKSIFGRVKEVTIPRRNGVCMGFAVVKFDLPEQAKEALLRCQNHSLHGRQIKIEQARQRPATANNSTDESSVKEIKKELPSKPIKKDTPILSNKTLSTTKILKRQIVESDDDEDDSEQEMASGDEDAEGDSSEEQSDGDNDDDDTDEEENMNEDEDDDNENSVNEEDDDDDDDDDDEPMDMVSASHSKKSLGYIDKEDNVNRKGESSVRSERGFSGGRGRGSNRGFAGGRGRGSDRGFGGGRGRGSDRGFGGGRGRGSDRGFSRGRGLGSDRGFGGGRGRGGDRGFGRGRGSGGGRGRGGDRGFGRGRSGGGRGFSRGRGAQKAW